MMGTTLAERPQGIHSHRLSNLSVKRISAGNSIMLNLILDSLALNYCLIALCVANCCSPWGHCRRPQLTNDRVGILLNVIAQPKEQAR